MVKYLKINGKDHPIRVSYYALKMVKEKLGKSIADMGTDYFDVQEMLLFYSLKKGAEIEGIEFTFTLEQMESVMDEVYMDFMTIIPEFFAKETEKKGKK